MGQPGKVKAPAKQAPKMPKGQRVMVRGNAPDATHGVRAAESGPARADRLRAIIRGTRAL